MPPARRRRLLSAGRCSFRLQLLAPPPRIAPPVNDLPVEGNPLSVREGSEEWQPPPPPPPPTEAPQWRHGQHALSAAALQAEDKAVAGELRAAGRVGNAGDDGGGNDGSGRAALFERSVPEGDDSSAVLAASPRPLVFGAVTSLPVEVLCTDGERGPDVLTGWGLFVFCARLLLLPWFLDACAEACARSSSAQFFYVQDRACQEGGCVTKSTRL